MENQIVPLLFDELLEKWHGSTEQLILNMSGDIENDLEELGKEKEEYKKRFHEALNS